MQTTAPLYQTDFYAWTRYQAQLLRNEELEKLDLANLAEEIEDMGKSEQRELENRLVVLLRHLLKLAVLPNSLPARGWRLTIKEQRQQLRRLFKKNPSLRALLPDSLDELYSDARELAVDDLLIDNLSPNRVLPLQCPFTLDQILDAAFFPAWP